MKEVLLFASFLLFSLVAKAQNVDQLEAQADEWSKQSYTQSKALSAYLSCIRQTKEKNGLFRLVDKTISIVKDKKNLYGKDDLVVDSIIDVTRPVIGKDEQHFLPLLEQRILNSSNHAGKYLQEFTLFEEAVKLRQSHNIQHGSEYEALLRWYVGHLYYKKELSAQDKLLTYAELWDLYRKNNPETDSLDIKLLDSYSLQCSLGKDYKTYVNLLELKKQYIEKTEGKNNESYLDVLNNLKRGYHQLYTHLYSADCNEMKPEKEKEMAYELELLQLKISMDKEIKDFEVQSILYDLLHIKKDTIEARKIATEFASWVELKSGKENETYCKALDRIIGTYGIGDVKTIPLLQELLELQEIIFGKEHTSCKTTQFKLQSVITELKYSQKDTIEARKVAIELTTWIEQKYGKENEIYCKFLNELVETYEMGDAETIPLLKELLALQEKVLGKDHILYEATQGQLTFALSQNHQMQESIEIQSSNIDKDDIIGLMTLSTQQTQYGQYHAAINTYEKMLEYCASNPDSRGAYLLMSVLGPINNYGSLKDLSGLLAFGNKWGNDNRFTNDERKYIFKQVVNTASIPDLVDEDIIEFIDIYILTNPSMASSEIERAELLEYKALAYWGMKRPKQAETIIRQILTSLRQTNAEDIVIIKYEHYLEICLLAQERFDEALTQNRNVLSLMTQLPNYKNYLEYWSLYWRAIVYYDKKDNFNEVLKLCSELDNVETTQLTSMAGSMSLDNYSTLNFGSIFFAFTNIIDESLVENQHYRALYKKGYKEEAKEMVKKDITEKMSLIKFTLSQMDNSMQQNTTVWTKQANDNLCNIAVLCGEDSLSIQTYNYILLYKQAFLATESIMREQLLNSGNEELKAKFSELQNLRATVQQYEKCGLSTDELSERIVQLDKQLVEDSKMYGDFTNSLNLTWDKVQKQLKQDDIAIEFLSYTSFEDNEEHIAALLLRSEWGSPKLVHLFSVKQIPEQIYDNTQFSQLCWGAVGNYLDGVKNIYFAPAGTLYNIGIESMLSPNGNGYMSEKYNLYRISSTRELVMNSDDKQIVPGKAVIYGGIDFQSEDEKMSTNAKTHEDNENSVLRDLRGAINNIPYLPKSKVEAENVADILGIKKHKETVQLFTGIAGTESTFKLISGESVKIVHIATHGFYNESPRADNSSSFYLIQQETEDKMLSKSGLLFAGAEKALLSNDNVSPQNDGILTAQEISTLDLRSLDLATLSACQTAQGDISGDGVFGLQRGFKKAGAKSILMSLWKVDDEATSLLMSEFYNNWIINKKTKHDALELAKQTVRSHKEKGWGNPKYWAAFILLDGID